MITISGLACLLSDIGRAMRLSPLGLRWRWWPPKKRAAKKNFPPTSYVQRLLFRCRCKKVPFLVGARKQVLHLRFDKNAWKLFRSFNLPFLCELNEVALRAPVAKMHIGRQTPQHKKGAGKKAIYPPSIQFHPDKFFFVPFNSSFSPFFRVRNAKWNREREKALSRIFSPSPRSGNLHPPRIAALQDIKFRSIAVTYFLPYYNCSKKRIARKKKRWRSESHFRLMEPVGGKSVLKRFFGRRRTEEDVVGRCRSLSLSLTLNVARFIPLTSSASLVEAVESRPSTQLARL